MNTLLAKIRRNLVITLSLSLIWFFLIIYFFEPLLHSFMNKEEDYIPDLQGMLVEDALSYLDSKGFYSKVNYIDFEEGCKQNTVVSTYPPSPQKINKNRPIEINVFSPRSNVKVLNFIGLNIKEAKRLSKNSNKIKVEINTKDAPVSFPRLSKSLIIEPKNFLNKKFTFGKIFLRVSNRRIKNVSKAIIKVKSS